MAVKAKKNDIEKQFSSMLEQAKEGFKKFGTELGVLAKKGEKEIKKASKAGKIQLDIVGLNMQKEKLYYDIGKKVVSLNAKKDLGIAELEPFWKKIRKIDSSARRKKRTLSGGRKNKK